MPSCVICAEETVLMVNGTPLCLECDTLNPAEREIRRTQNEAKTREAQADAGI
jgi:hypothetical protein